jgi:hypothetical protein
VQNIKAAIGRHHLPPRLAQLLAPRQQLKPPQNLRLKIHASIVAKAGRRAIWKSRKNLVPLQLLNVLSFSPFPGLGERGRDAWRDARSRRRLADGLP